MNTQSRQQNGTRYPAGIEEPPEIPPILLNPPCRSGYDSPAGEEPPVDPGHPNHPDHPHPDDDHPADHTEGSPWTQPAPAGAPAAAARQNQRNLTPAARAELHRRLRDYVASAEDPIGYHQANGHVHRTPQFLPWHRQFIERFERWQRTRLADPAAFIPLAFWDPADPIPSEFPHGARNSNIPSMPIPAELGVERLAALDYAQFSSMLETLHNRVHDTIGGDMRTLSTAPRDTCFWLFHAYVDNVFAQWEVMRRGPNT